MDLTAGQMLKYDEGISRQVYRDSMGKHTVGIGFNMDDPTAKSVWKKLAIPEGFDDVYDGLTSLSIQSISDLLHKTVDMAFQQAQSVFVSYNNMPALTQLAILNMIFQLGLPKFLQFKHTIELLKAGNYEAAATEALDSEWAREVPKRAARVTSLMKGELPNAYLTNLNSYLN